MHVELISFSPFYCNENATKETTQEEHLSEHLFWVHVQTLVLLITVKTCLVFFGQRLFLA